MYLIYEIRNHRPYRAKVHRYIENRETARRYFRFLCSMGIRLVAFRVFKGLLIFTQNPIF